MNALIADDDQIIRIFLRRILEGRLQCQVIEAENGRQVLEILQKVRPDFMLLDICMPELSGDELLVMIRNTHAYKDLPVIIFSAISDKNLIEKMFSLGILDYLIKPMEVQETFDRIKILMKIIESVNRTNGNLTASVPPIETKLTQNNVRHIPAGVKNQ